MIEELALAEGAFDRGDYAEAIRLFRLGCDRESPDAPVVSNAVRAHDCEVVSWLGRLAERWPSNEDVLAAYGRRLYELGRPEEAWQVCEIRWQPSTPAYELRRTTLSLLICVRLGASERVPTLVRRLERPESDLTRAAASAAFFLPAVRHYGQASMTTLILFIDELAAHWRVDGLSKTLFDAYRNLAESNKSFFQEKARVHSTDADR